MEHLIDLNWVIECENICENARREFDAMYQRDIILLNQEHEKEIAKLAKQNVKFFKRLKKFNKPQIKETKRPEKSEISQYKADESLRKERVRIENFGLEYKKSYACLAMNINARIKKYKFNLQKAINIPVNAISSLSGSHLIDKFERLKTLLQGSVVNVNDNLRVCTIDYPQALAFCKDSLAEKFVRQGYEVVAYNYTTAFPIATVIIGLWAEIPVFGDLFLSHLYKACPNILSYDEKNQCPEILGYDMEKQDEILKRMSGLARLYFSVICSPMQQVFDKPHPHGIKNGWKWLNRTLNLKPIPVVTPTILYDFLDTAGFAMQQAYGIRFDNLLTVLHESYLPKIRRVSQNGCNGPIVRLEIFLQKCVKHKKLSPVEGLLSHDFLGVRPE